MLAAGASAELSASDRAVIKEMTRGSLYLRNNVPCRFTSGMGIGAEVITEVSPTAIDWEKNLNASAASVNKGKLRRVSMNTIYWGFGPNDIIRHGKPYFRGGGVVEPWAEGVKPKDVEIRIRSVGIDSRDDFKKAYDLILSNKPLQDEYPEWPTEIKTAIGGRRVIDYWERSAHFIGAITTTLELCTMPKDRRIWQRRTRARGRSSSPAEGQPTMHRTFLILVLAAGFTVLILGQKEDREGGAWLEGNHEAAAFDVTGIWRNADWVIVSGNNVYLLFCHKGKVAYSAKLAAEGPAVLTGVYTSGLLTSASKTRPMRLTK